MGKSVPADEVKGRGPAFTSLSFLALEVSYSPTEKERERGSIPMGDREMGGKRRAMMQDTPGVTLYIFRVPP